MGLDNGFGGTSLGGSGNTFSLAAVLHGSKNMPCDTVRIAGASLEQVSESNILGWKEDRGI